jgi:RNA polymerase sigma-70 factor, ECF subfamily
VSERGAIANPALPEVAEDQQLLARIQRRDQSALAQLYDRYGTVLFSFSMRILRDRALAQEVVQDVFLRCWNDAAIYDVARGRVASWLLALTRNRSIDVSRSRSHQARLRESGAIIDDAATLESKGGDVGERVLVSNWVGSALEALPKKERAPLELAYFLGLTQNEIATKLNEPLGTIKTRMRAGLERLRALLEPGESERQQRGEEHRV